MNGEKMNAHAILVGKPDGKRSLGRTGLRWESNIKTDLREIGKGDIDWIHLDHDRDQWSVLVKTVMNVDLP
jgi:hypothetical protein